jgi:hypothetical protein
MARAVLAARHAPVDSGLAGGRDAGAGRRIREHLDAFWRRAATAWLARLAAEFGGSYGVAHSDHFALLAPLSARECQVTLDFAERVRRRILKALPGVAASDGHGPIAILLFDDPEDYYAYVDHYYPSEGVFAMSSGMFVDAGYGHFVFMADDVSQMEPVLVHELTHALLRHLNLPRWLDEGAAVNMEKYLVPHLADPRRNLYAAHELYTPRTRWPPSMRRSGTNTRSRSSGPAIRFCGPTTATCCPTTWPNA